ncbi:MAG: hypothetical protein EZS28_033089, partial [Streblomastix strix]
SVFVFITSYGQEGGGTGGNFFYLGFRKLLTSLQALLTSGKVSIYSTEIRLV